MSLPLVRTALVATGATLLAASAPASSLGAQQPTGPARSPIASETGTVRGRVLETGSQRPVSDAQVFVPGTTIGVVTNANGEFTLGSVPVGTRTVRVRRIGFQVAEQQVTVASGTPARVDFRLSSSATQLDQVVVTGTAGAVERRTVGNSITQVNAAEVTERNTILNVGELLQGKAPGVTLLPGSGATGTAGEIRIRGASSTSGYQPVVFIDGVRYNISDLGSFSASGAGTAGLAQASQVTSALNWLNPNDIESIEIVKGPAAATLYGAEAANGVIQIITKKGQRGQQALNWNLLAERGRNEWFLFPEDNLATCDAAKQAERVSATDTTRRWPGCQGLPVNTVIRGNPIRDDPRAIRTGDLSRLSLNLRGGGERYTTFVSANRDAEQGVFRNNDVTRTSIRTNFGFTPSTALDFNVVANWQDGRTRLPIQDESANGLLISAVRGQPGRLSPLGRENEGWSLITPDAANRYRNFTNTERLTFSGTANWKPAGWTRHTATLGVDDINNAAQLLFLPAEISAAQDPDAASGANIRRESTTRTITLNYNGDLLWNPTKSLGTTTSFGSQVIGIENSSLRADGIGLGAPDVILVGSAQRTQGSEGFSENNTVGYYLQEQLAFRDRLFLTGALRADDHSAFGTNFDLIVYPKFSLSYVLSDEPVAKGFFEAVGINSFKFRSAWGKAGRAPTAYSAPQTFTVDRVTLGNTTGSAARTSSFGNPDLKPEMGTELELGFEASAFKDRLGADLTYYDKTTSDMLQSVGVAPSAGFIGSRLTNLGEVTNRGVELALFGVPVERPSFRWDTRLNLSTNQNRLVSFGITGRLLETPTGQAYGAVQQHRPGYPLGGFWVAPALRCGVDALAPTAATTGNNACRYNQGEAQLTSAGAAIFNPGDTARRYMGSSIPTREVGLSNTFTLFRNFRVYALLDYKGGFSVYNFQERNRCQAANDNCARVNDPRARFPQTPADTILNRELAVYRSTSISPEWIQDGDFIKLREVSLSVDIPQRFLRMTRTRSASLVFSGRNLALWSKYEGVDPEVNSYGGRNFVRVDAYAAPMMRRFSAAVNATF